MNEEKKLVQIGNGRGVAFLSSRAQRGICISARQKSRRAIRYNKPDAEAHAVR
jgi:hypothetical protein